MTKVRDCSKDLVAPHTEEGRHSPDPRRTPCALRLLVGLSRWECFSNSSVSVTHTLATPDSSLSWIGLQPPGFYLLFFPSGIPSVKVLPPKPNLTFSLHLKLHHIPQESPPPPIAPRILSPCACPAPSYRHHNAAKVLPYGLFPHSLWFSLGFPLALL